MIQAVKPRLNIGQLQSFMLGPSLGNVVSKSALFQFKTISPCPATICPYRKSLLSFSVGSLQVLKGHYKISSEPSFLQAEEPQLSACSYRGCASALWSSSWYAFGPAPTAPCPSCVGGSRTGCITPGEVSWEQTAESSRSTCWSHFSWCIPVGLLGCKRTLPAHVESFINWHPQILLLRAALKPFSAQLVSVPGIAPAQS